MWFQAVKRDIDDSRLFPLAFSMMKGTGMPLLRVMEETGMPVSDFFLSDSRDVAVRLGLREASVVDAYLREEAVAAARSELEFCDRHSIRVLSPADESYPLRLRELPDAPTSLFVLGDCDLNAQRIISIVGTRTPTPYGTAFVKSAVEELEMVAAPVTVVSGLAYGIDVCAHMAALSCGAPTVAVVAHGLDTLYPAAHRDVARRIVREGGAIVSEYPHGNKPFRGRFLERNRIVAALSDACLVAESDIKGGAMSTAAIAFGIDREVMALPGRISDRFSSGCNHLIRKNRAWLVSRPADIAEIMDWQPVKSRADVVDRSLFPELDEPQRSIFECISGSVEPVSIDEMHVRLGFPVAVLMAQLGEMEFDGLVVKYPGNRYHPA